METGTFLGHLLLHRCPGIHRDTGLEGGDPRWRLFAGSFRGDHGPDGRLDRLRHPSRGAGREEDPWPDPVLRRVHPADKPVVPVIVTVSEVAFVVNVIPVPAASVKVSVALSATTLLCPETAIVLKLSEALPLDTVLNESAPLPSVVNT